MGKLRHEDDKQACGHAWTSSYHCACTDKVSVALEWLTVRTHHVTWDYYDTDDTATERRAQPTLRAGF